MPPKLKGFSFFEGKTLLNDLSKLFGVHISVGVFPLNVLHIPFDVNVGKKFLHPPLFQLDIENFLFFKLFPNSQSMTSFP